VLLDASVTSPTYCPTNPPPTLPPRPSIFFFDQHKHCSSCFLSSLHTQFTFYSHIMSLGRTVKLNTGASIP
jgi:hypothetical protein